MSSRRQGRKKFRGKPASRSSLSGGTAASSVVALSMAKPLLGAGLGLLRRGMTPAVSSALAMGGLGQVGELIGEHAGAEQMPLLSQPVQVVRGALEQLLADQAVQVLDGHLRVNPKK